MKDAKRPQSPGVGLIYGFVAVFASFRSSRCCRSRLAGGAGGGGGGNDWHSLSCCTFASPKPQTSPKLLDFLPNPFRSPCRGYFIHERMNRLHRLLTPSLFLPIQCLWSYLLRCRGLNMALACCDCTSFVGPKRHRRDHTRTRTRPVTTKWPTTDAATDLTTHLSPDFPPSHDRPPDQRPQHCNTDRTADRSTNGSTDRTTPDHANWTTDGSTAFRRNHRSDQVEYYTVCFTAFPF